MQKQLSKLDKIIFSVALFLNGILYAILIPSLIWGYYTPYTSGLIRATVFGLATILFLKDLFVYKFESYPKSFWAIFIYAAMAGLAILLYEQSVFTGGELPETWKNLYLFISYGLTNLFLFIMSRPRLEFFIRNSFLVWLPALISASIILLIAREYMISDMGVTQEGINRSTIKMPFLILFTVSFAMFAFPSKVYGFFRNALFNMVLAAMGLAISGYGIYISTSQSSILSAGAVFATAWLLTFKFKRAIVTMGIFTAAFATWGIQYMIRSDGWQRLTNLMNLDLLYNLGGDYDVSRIDLIKEGWRLFLSSPVIGGNAYLSEGTYTHFFLMDSLMATGLIGLTLILMIFVGALKGAFKLTKTYGEDSFWIILLCAMEISQFCLHGSLISMMSFAFAILISAQALKNREIPPFRRF